MQYLHCNGYHIPLTQSFNELWLPSQSSTVLLKCLVLLPSCHIVLPYHLHLLYYKALLWYLSVLMCQNKALFCHWSTRSCFTVPILPSYALFCLHSDLIWQHSTIMMCNCMITVSTSFHSALMFHHNASFDFHNAVLYTYKVVLNIILFHYSALLCHYNGLLCCNSS